MRLHLAPLVLLAACSSDPMPRDGAPDDASDTATVLDAPDTRQVDAGGGADEESDAAPVGSSYDTAG